MNLNSILMLILLIGCNLPKDKIIINNEHDTITTINRDIEIKEIIIKGENRKNKDRLVLKIKPKKKITSFNFNTYSNINLDSLIQIYDDIYVDVFVENVKRDYKLSYHKEYDFNSEMKIDTISPNLH